MPAGLATLGHRHGVGELGLRLTLGAAIDHGQAGHGYDPRFGQSRNDGLALFLGGRQILPPLSGRDTRPSGAALAEATGAPAPAPPARAPPEPWPPHLRRLMSGARLWRGGLVYFLPGGRNLGHGRRPPWRTARRTGCRRPGSTPCGAYPRTARCCRWRLARARRRGRPPAAAWRAGRSCLPICDSIRGHAPSVDTRRVDRSVCATVERRISACPDASGARTTPFCRNLGGMTRVRVAQRRA